MPKPIAMQEPYPTLEGVGRDAYSLRIISPAYATPQGELNAILQYVYHSVMFKMNGHKDIADNITGIAISEMRHLEILGSVIFALGGAPLYSQYPPACFNFYSAKYVAYSNTLKNMLEDDVRAEKRAIADYERMLQRLKSEDVKKIISRILLDEKLHLGEFEKMLKEFNC